MTKIQLIPLETSDREQFMKDNTSLKINVTILSKI